MYPKSKSLVSTIGFKSKNGHIRDTVGQKEACTQVHFPTRSKEAPCQYPSSPCCGKH